MSASAVAATATPMASQNHTGPRQPAAAKTKTADDSAKKAKAGADATAAENTKADKTASDDDAKAGKE